MSNFFSFWTGFCLALCPLMPLTVAAREIPVTEEGQEIVIDGRHYLQIGPDQLSSNEFLKRKIETSRKEFTLNQDLSREMMRMSNTVLTFESFYSHDPNIKSALDVYGYIGIDLKDLFEWTARTIQYAEEEEEEKTREEYASQGFSIGQGDCFTYSSVFYYLAKGLGYPVRIVNGTVRYTDGSQGDHSWCLINHDGKEYIYDPQAHQQLREKELSFFAVDPLDPPIRYQYPSGEEPLGGNAYYE